MIDDHGCTLETAITLPNLLALHRHRHRLANAAPLNSSRFHNETLWFNLQYSKLDARRAGRLSAYLVWRQENRHWSRGVDERTAYQRLPSRLAVAVPRIYEVAHGRKMALSTSISSRFLRPLQPEPCETLTTPKRPQRCV